MIIVKILFYFNLLITENFFKGSNKFLKLAKILISYIIGAIVFDLVNNKRYNLLIQERHYISINEWNHSMMMMELKNTNYFDPEIVLDWFSYIYNYLGSSMFWVLEHIITPAGKYENYIIAAGIFGYTLFFFIAQYSIFAKTIVGLTGPYTLEQWCFVTKWFIMTGDGALIWATTIREKINLYWGLIVKYNLFLPPDHWLTYIHKPPMVTYTDPYVISIISGMF